MAAPSMTFNAAGNIRSSSSLAAGDWATGNLDYSTKVEGQLTIKNTPGSLSGTRGVRVDIFSRYGNTPADTTLPVLSYFLPSAASTAESMTIFIGTGKWTWKITNLDAVNATTVEITDATVDGIG